MIAVAIGVAAAALSIASFVPQVWKIVKTRETKDLATPMWILNSTAFALWATYGAILGNWPIIVPNAICLVLALFILMMKLVPRSTRDAVADAVARR
jgi:MtN3 and saliva related transmembrane protein